MGIRERCLFLNGAHSVGMDIIAELPTQDAYGLIAPELSALMHNALVLGKSSDNPSCGKCFFI